MYQGFAAHQNWDFEVLNYTNAEYGETSFLQGGTSLLLTKYTETSFNLCVTGGLHHAAARVAGEDVYRHLKHEGGTHRVQRIPEVGLSSRMQRIHTGTMSVIVLPQPAEVRFAPPPLARRVITVLRPRSICPFSVRSWTSTSIRRTSAWTRSGLEAPAARA